MSGEEIIRRAYAEGRVLSDGKDAGRRGVTPGEEIILRAYAERRVLSDGREGVTQEGSGDGHLTEAAAPPFSDESLALAFAAEHSTRLRYVNLWARWLSYQRGKWTIDETLDVYDRVRATCRREAAEAKGKQAKEIASAKTVAAVERLAKADRRLAASPDLFDRDPWLLNTPDCVIDLRDGRSRSHRPDDMFTRSTSVSPAGDCPRWLKFLWEIAGGDEAKIEYLSRVFGYALTGRTSEHALFFAFGTGANGKSVFISTAAGILGDYHRTAPIETFVASSSDRHPTELAGLRGARLVSAIETEEGRRWAESKIKSLTGGDRISARFMRQDFFEFDPQFKLLIAGNHKPGLRSVDESIRRRFHLIPFARTIPVEDRDPDLADKLRDEWPGILAWAIEGCLRWQESGLSTPESVRDATDEYLGAEDSIAVWLDEACDKDPQAFATSAALFQSWSAWATRAGEPVGSGKRLTQALESKGFRKKDTAKARGFEGVRIRDFDPALDLEQGAER